MLSHVRDGACPTHSLTRLGNLVRDSDPCLFPLLLVISPAEPQFPLKPKASFVKTKMEGCSATTYPPIPYLCLWFLILGKFPETTATHPHFSPISSLPENLQASHKPFECCLPTQRGSPSLEMEGCLPLLGWAKRLSPWHGGSNYQVLIPALVM